MRGWTTALLAAPDAGQDARASVLIVDDSADFRFLLTRILSRSDRYEVMGEAADGAEAIEKVRAATPDIVLLDLRMPGMDGFEAIPHIRKLAPTTRIVVVSGLDASEVAERCIALGADAFIEKHDSPAEFQAALLGLADIDARK